MALAFAPAPVSDLADQSPAYVARVYEPSPDIPSGSFLRRAGSIAYLVFSLPVESALWVFGNATKTIRSDLEEIRQTGATIVRPPY